MGLFSTGVKNYQTPGLGQFTGNLTNMAGTLGGADYGQRQAKKLMGQMAGGDYEGLLGTYLSPLKDQYAVNQRENDRNLMMGANAMGQQSNPGYYASIANEGRLKNQEGLGMALGSAVPQLYGQAQQAFGAGRQRQLGELGLRGNLLEAALQGQIGGNRPITSPSWLSQMSQAAQGAGSLAMGLCWVARALYGDNDWRVALLRHWLVNVWAVRSRVGAAFVALYQRFGERMAKVVARNRVVNRLTRYVFDQLVQRAIAENV